MQIHDTCPRMALTTDPRRFHPDFSAMPETLIIEEQN
jgi:hypothetical protein